MKTKATEKHNTEGEERFVWDRFEQVRRASFVRTIAEMVDALKSVVSEICSLWNKIDSQTVGVITVLAISGSIFLLTLRHKSLLLKNYKRSSKTISLGTESWHSLLTTKEEGGKKKNSANDSYCRECKKASVVKKVRFAADVIEPSGDNRDYRRRMKARLCQRLAQEKEAGKGQTASNL